MTKHESPYLGDFQVLTLTPSEVARLRMFVRDVLATIQDDVDGVTWDLEEPALVAAEILRMKTPSESSESD